MYQIFISYRRLEGDSVAFLLYEALQQRGYHPFFDFESIKSGFFDKAIYDTMNTCTDYLLVCTEDSLRERTEYADDWLYNEIEYALKLAAKGSINIIPILVDNFTFPDDLPARIEPISKFNGIRISYEFFGGFMDKLETRLSCSNYTQIDMSNRGERNNNVIVWADIKENLLLKLLGKIDPSNKYNFCILEAPTDLLKLTELSSYHAILFIDVDMDRLGDSERKVRAVNDAIKSYVKEGGLFLCTHDILFKKMHNDILIDMMGMWTNYFEAVPVVHYLKQPCCEEEHVFTSMPDEFDLADAEECWGEISPENNIYFKSPKGRPLVVGNEYAKGAWFWFNTGDAREYPPETLLRTDINFARLIKEALDFKK